MYIKNFIKWSLILAALVWFKKTYADDALTPQPVHFAYLTMMQSAAAADENERESMVGQIAEHMAFNPRRSNLFFDYLVTADESLRAANDNVTEQLLCSRDKFASEAEMFDALDTLKTVRATNLASQYRHAIATVGREHGDELTTWLTALAPESTPDANNDRAMYERLGMDADAVIAASCNQLAGSMREGSLSTARYAR